MKNLETAAIVLTGLPASGKTTVGKYLASRLGWPFLDKDDFLESLYDAAVVSTMEERKSLNRQSDQMFEAAARVQGKVVLVSHWTPREGPLGTGTPTEWLLGSFDRVIEVYCDCLVETATDRFFNRERHGGHLDAQRSQEEFRQKMQAMRDGSPLNLGKLVMVDTTKTPDIERIIEQFGAF